ncbi:hypothetical protein HDE_00897 [Halotydeus destructor]|nr:hypothetical protein HDE_00897 [Halotydeus destructor]
MANDKLAVLAIAMGAILYVILLFLNLDRWYVSVSTSNQDSMASETDPGAGIMFRFTSRKPVERTRSPAENHPTVPKPQQRPESTVESEEALNMKVTEQERPTYRSPFETDKLLTPGSSVETTKVSEPSLSPRKTAPPAVVSQSQPDSTTASYPIRSTAVLYSPRVETSTLVESNSAVGLENHRQTAEAGVGETTTSSQFEPTGLVNSVLLPDPNAALPGGPMRQAKVKPDSGHGAEVTVDSDFEQQMIFTIPDASFILPLPSLMPKLKSVLAWQTGASVMEAGPIAITQIPRSAHPLTPMWFEQRRPGPCYFGTSMPDGGTSYDLTNGTPLLLHVGDSTASKTEVFRKYLVTNEKDFLVASRENDADGNVIQVKVKSHASLWIQPGYMPVKLSDGVGYYHPFTRDFMADEVLFVEIVGVPETISEIRDQHFLDRHSLLLRQLSSMIVFLYKLEGIEPKYGCTKFVYKIDYLDDDLDARSTVTNMEKFFEEFTKDYSTFELFKSYVILKALQDHSIYNAVADYMRRNCVRHLAKVQQKQLLSSREDFALKSYFFNDLLQPRDDAHALLVVELYQKLNQTLIPTGGLVSQKWEDLPDALTDGLDPGHRTPTQLVALREYPSVS